MRKIDYSKIQEGIYEIKKERFNKLEEVINEEVVKGKKEISRINKEEQRKYKKKGIDYYKRLTAENIKIAGKKIFSGFTEIAKDYIDIKSYEEEFSNFIEEKIKEIRNYNPQEVTQK